MNGSVLYETSMGFRLGKGDAFAKYICYCLQGPGIIRTH